MQFRPFAPYAAILAVLAFHATRFDRLWVPHDEGVIAHPAERVLNGEMPHIDFVSGYSGGLDYLHAGAMRLFGTNLLAPRIGLFIFFAVWLVVVLKIARTFAGPLLASALILLAGLASLPQYPAAMPSWYNLFFATLTVLALLRYRASAWTPWLIAAGAAAGLSISIKVIGLYAVAGALLSFGFWATEAPPDFEKRVRSRASGWVVASVLAPFVGSVAWLVRERLASADAIYLLLPTVLLSGVIVARAASSRQRGGEIVRQWSLHAFHFLAGTAAVLLLGSLPYLLSDSAGALVYGVFGRAGLYIETFEGTAFPGGTATLVGLGAAGSLVAAAYAPRALRWWWSAAVLGGLLVLAIVSGRGVTADFMLITTRPWVPLLASWAGFRLMRPAPLGNDCVEDGTVAVLVCMTALVSLVQFPIAADWYVFYFAPLAVLSAGALFTSARSLGAPATGIAALLYGGWLVLNSVNLQELSTRRIDLPRSDLRVIQEDAEAYERLVFTIDSLAAGPVILALPDIPEVYFLANRRNPTGVLFDVYENPQERIAQVRRALTSERVDLVVIGNRIGNPGELDPGLRALVDSAFPVELPLGRFTLRLKGDETP